MPHTDWTMTDIDPADQEVRETYFLMIGGIGPRPIALVSTVSKEGVNNVAPFSFFNGFGANPPMVAFSPARGGRNNQTKDTYNNLMETKECVVQVCTYAMAEQINIAAAEFDKSIDEFEKSGLTTVDSKVVKPKRVKEAPFQMECTLYNMIALGDGPGSGNLAICEVKMFHVASEVLSDGRIDPYKMDLIGRNGGAFYTRAQGDALFEMRKPETPEMVGFDGLPKWLKKSEQLSANDLGKVASQKMPSTEELNEFKESPVFKELVSTLDDKAKGRQMIESKIKEWVNNQECFQAALAALVTGDSLN